MTRLVRIVVVLGIGTLALVGALLSESSPLVTELIVIAVALVVAEQFQLHPANRAPLPLSFAVMVVLTRATDPREYAVVVVIRDAKGAELARKVIGVGGLAAGDERQVELTVEIFDPQAAS